MILHNSFDVDTLVLEGNSAYYGGAIFVSADLSSNAAFSNLTFINNIAAEGVSQIHAMLQRDMSTLCTPPHMNTRGDSSVKRRIAQRITPRLHAGSSQYWLYESSPLAPLDCINCSTSPVTESPFATEPLHIAFDGSPPSSVVSAEVWPMHS